LSEISRIFRGLSAFPITPSDTNGRVDVEGLSRLLMQLADARVDSVGLLGSTGSYVYLDRTERRRAIEAAREAVGGRVPLMVGVGALRTDEAMALARDAEEAGASSLLLAPVSYLPLTEDEVVEHFTKVAGATGLPLAIYNNPTTTHFSFSTALFARLATVKNIVAMKTAGSPAPDIAHDVKALRAALPAGFAIGFSGDWFGGGALLAGGDTWYSVVGGLLPKPTLALARAAQSGAAAEVAKMEARFEPLFSLFRELSSFRVMYAAAGILGLGDFRPPAPILPLDGPHRARIAAALETLAG
jgi:4-hydroxy-tetrahydrodipicolinate synthase